MKELQKGSKHKLVVGVTVGSSAFSLLRGQLKWFNSSGWDVTLVTSPDERARRAAKREDIQLIGIPMERGISPRKDFVSLISWIRFLRAKRPDAVNVGTPKASLLGMVAAWLVRIPRRLYVVRGLRLEGTQKPLSFVLWAIEKLTMRLATDVLFVSDSLAAEAGERRLLFPEKSWIIGAGSSNGVDAEAISERIRKVNRDELRTKLGFHPEDFVVGYIGRITRDKGVDVLAHALNNSALDQKVRALLIGQMEDHEVEQQLKSLGERAKIMPSTDDVWGYLPAMDVLCLPTMREGFPNVVLEAASAGVPSITTRSTGAVDSVVPGKTGVLIDVGDVEALIESLNNMSGDLEFTREMGAAARRRAREEYSQERIWNGLVEILTGVHEPREAVSLKLSIRE